jgi:hypothetical protein
MSTATQVDTAEAYQRLTDWVQQHNAQGDVHSIDLVLYGAQIQLKTVEAMRRHFPGQEAARSQFVGSREWMLYSEGIRFIAWESCGMNRSEKPEQVTL